MDFLRTDDDRYRGGSTVWRLLLEDEWGDNIPHVHGCPECYEHVPCSMACTLEPDLELDDGTPSGGYFVCKSCSGEIEPPEEPKAPWDLDKSEPLFEWAQLK